MSLAILFSILTLPGICDDFRIPNTISHDNGHVLRLNTSCQFSEFRITIFDRNGNTRFTAQKTSFELNMLQHQSKEHGIFESGIYFYMVEARTQQTNKIFSHSGYFAFMR